LSLRRKEEENEIENKTFEELQLKKKEKRYFSIHLRTCFTDALPLTAYIRPRER
jgi:hypothetical protein